MSRKSRDQDAIATSVEQLGQIAELYRAAGDAVEEYDRASRCGAVVEEDRVT
jgi:hypothetical protein